MSADKKANAKDHIESEAIRMGLWIARCKAEAKHKQRREIDRQRVHEVINSAFSGKALTLRTAIIEESQQKLPEIKPGAFNLKQVLRDYFKEEQTSKFAIELLKHLREGDTDGAKNITAEFYQIHQKKGEINDT